jgi:hypothetical protein
VKHSPYPLQLSRIPVTAVQGQGGIGCSPMQQCCCCWLADTCNTPGWAIPPKHVRLCIAKIKKSGEAPCLLGLQPHLLHACVLCVGCAGRPCDVPSSPVGGTVNCNVDLATGKVLTGNTCELTCRSSTHPRCLSPPSPAWMAPWTPPPAA